MRSNLFGDDFLCERSGPGRKQLGSIVTHALAPFLGCPLQDLVFPQNRPAIAGKHPDSQIKRVGVLYRFIVKMRGELLALRDADELAALVLRRFVDRMRATERAAAVHQLQRCRPSSRRHAGAPG